jgi:hypothetical protein
MLTEDQIEERFERTMDSLDKKYLNDIITAHTYNLSVELLKEWAEEHLSKL